MSIRGHRTKVRLFIPFVFTTRANVTSTRHTTTANVTCNRNHRHL